MSDRAPGSSADKGQPSTSCTGSAAEDDLAVRPTEMLRSPEQEGDHGTDTQGHVAAGLISTGELPDPDAVRV